MFRLADENADLNSLNLKENLHVENDQEKVYVNRAHRFIDEDF